MADSHLFLHENSHKTRRTVAFDSSAWTLSTLHQDSCWGELITSGEQRLLSQQRPSERNIHLCFVPKYNFSPLVLEKFHQWQLHLLQNNTYITALQAGKKRVRFPIISEFFYWLNPSIRTVPLGPTQPLTKIGARDLSWGVKAADA